MIRGTKNSFRGYALKKTFHAYASMSLNLMEATTQYRAALLCSAREKLFVLCSLVPLNVVLIIGVNVNRVFVLVSASTSSIKFR